MKRTKEDIDEISVHCAATPEGRDIKIDTINTWHVDRGFDEVGYHYVIYLDGTIVEGRDILKVGAHVRGHNRNSIGICYIGGTDKSGNPKDTRTTEQLQAMEELVVRLINEYDIVAIKGHNDYPNVNKACPSFDVGSWVNQQAIWSKQK